jgi:hypothetical protein
MDLCVGCGLDAGFAAAFVGVFAVSRALQAARAAPPPAMISQRSESRREIDLF